MGNHKYIETPEKMWEYFEAYRKEIKNKPILKHVFVGKDGMADYEKRDRPLTLEGFENWCFEKQIINNLDNYFANSNDAYKDFSSICSRIRKVIRQDQIEGGMAGIYNPSITQRLNGLKESQDINLNTSVPILSIDPLNANPTNNSPTKDS